MSPRPPYAALVADAAWCADGKPERDPYEPTTVGRRDYDEWADRLLGAALAAGLRLRPTEMRS